MGFSSEEEETNLLLKIIEKEQGRIDLAPLFIWIINCQGKVKLVFKHMLISIDADRT